MNKEIERKFLVKNTNYKFQAQRKSFIAQGYLSDDPSRTVRVRIKGDKAFITIKGITNMSGISRDEWEYEIPVNEATELLELSKNNPIFKTRYEIMLGDLIFEVDEFEAENRGLILAEIELDSEKQDFEIPDWLGEEVTGNVKYYNSYLSTHPFKKW
jgi:adenylate cyclase